MQPTGSSSDDAASAAAAALASGIADDPLARSRGQLQDPVPVVSPAGVPMGWMVPVGLGDALLGFIQLFADARFPRYAAFARPDDSAAGCPSMRDWLDREVIIDRARKVTGGSSTFDVPVLSYDGSPDRLAWLVRATGPDGEVWLVYVAGRAAWLGSPPGAESPGSTG
jgi:hypothetical protein